MNKTVIRWEGFYSSHLLIYSKKKQNIMALPDWLRISPVSGKGPGVVSIEADPNEGCDRSVEVTAATTKGPSATLTVTQAGMREPFAGSDMDFILSDGGTFNVLKTNQM